MKEVGISNHNYNDLYFFPGRLNKSDFSSFVIITQLQFGEFIL